MSTDNQLIHWEKWLSWSQSFKSVHIPTLPTTLTDHPHRLHRRYYIDGWHHYNRSTASWDSDDNDKLMTKNHAPHEKIWYWRKCFPSFTKSMMLDLREGREPTRSTCRTENSEKFSISLCASLHKIASVGWFTFHLPETCTTDKKDVTIKMLKYTDPEETPVYYILALSFAKN